VFARHDISLLLPTASAHENDDTHMKAIPTQEAKRSKPGEEVSSDRALPDSADKSGVAKISAGDCTASESVDATGGSGGPVIATEGMLSIFLAPFMRHVFEQRRLLVRLH
jgi:hypothetical protein